MARFGKRALAGLLPFIFSLLAFTFSMLAVTSPDWASRKQYADNTDAVSQTAPIYTLYRSPFQICVADMIADNSTSPQNSTSGNQDDQPPPVLNSTYKSNCSHFKVYGSGATSCELPSVLGRNLATQVGDARQCQQIHLAANYHVASAVFLGVAMLVSLAVAIGGLVSLLSDTKRHRGDLQEGEAANSHRHGYLRSLLSLAPTLLFPFVAVGAGTALIAQFYAILGLVQSAPNNADFASSQGNREHHDPWVQGKALNTYLSFSWFWALLAAWACYLVWGGVSLSKSRKLR
jgi:hypothetical protein